MRVCSVCLCVCGCALMCVYVWVQTFVCVFLLLLLAERDAKRMVTKVQGSFWHADLTLDGAGTKRKPVHLHRIEKRVQINSLKREFFERLHLFEVRSTGKMSFQLAGPLWKWSQTSCVSLAHFCMNACQLGMFWLCVSSRPINKFTKHSTQHKSTLYVFLTTPVNLGGLWGNFRIITNTAST